MAGFLSVLRHRCMPAFLVAIFAAPINLAAQAASQNAPTDIVIQNATVMTVTHGAISHGSVWIHNGKIAGVGAQVIAPAGARTIDAAGKYVTPESSTRIRTLRWATISTKPPARSRPR